MPLLRTLLAALLLTLGGGYAQTVLVHPFQGDDLLGLVLADRVAEALAERADTVIGPVAAPSLAPPFPYGEGFVNPLAVLRDGGIDTLHAARLLRDASGVDLVVSGRVVTDASGVALRLVLVDANGGSVQRELHAPDDAPSRLADAAAVTAAGRLGLPAPPPAAAIDMAGDDDVLGRLLALMAGGFLQEAEQLLERASASGARIDALREVLTLVRDPDADLTAAPAERAWEVAMVALAGGSDLVRLDAALDAAYRASGLPAALSWRAAIALDGGELDAAAELYRQAGVAYPYGAAADALHRYGAGDESARRDLVTLAEGQDAAALVAITLLAELLEDRELERAAATTLARVVPTFAYPFERLSFLAFRAEDGLAAARALAVAVELEPDSDLYWTNLGWAWYLLGFWERSEEASLRALELAPNQRIAAYNLGLVRARFGRLSEAMEAYRIALSSAQEVDEEAYQDVVDALEARPLEPALHYVDGRLSEARGDRAAATAAYQRFLELGGHGAPFDARAEERIRVLSAPLPPLEISAGRVEATLAGLVPDGYRPGDPLSLRFEAYTEGDALPERITADATLRAVAAAEDAEPLLHTEAQVEVPAQAIGYVVQDELFLELPVDLEAGRYLLTVTIRGDDEQRATARSEITVAGDPDPLRRLIGRRVELLALDSGRPLFAAADVTRRSAVVNAMVSELRSTASAAEEALPMIEQGPFAGLSGGALFEQATERDLEAFLAFLVEDGVHDARLTFVDAFAGWAVDGAPGR